MGEPKGLGEQNSACRLVTSSLVMATDWERLVTSGPASFRSLESAPERDGNCSLPVLPAASQNVGPNWHSHMASHREGGVGRHEMGRGIMGKGVFS